jgi:WS/DGAT/MGAT family acyltransferase
MERLNSLDALFVDAEDQDRHTSMAIASIAVFEGPAPSYDEFLASLAGRLPLVPRYRQKLRAVPLRLGPPVWVDDPDFDLRYHVRQTALPAPGGDEQLGRLMARVMTQRLDRDYPLWEYWLVEGLAQDRWALISKVHHCMVDGVSGTDLYRVIFDASPEPSPPAVDDRTVSAEPSPRWLAARAALDAVLLPVREAAALRGALASPGRAVRQATDAMRGMAKLATSAWPATGSSLSGPIGRQRRYTWARASLDDVKTIKRELGGTVNDVVLAAISGGFRALLLARGEQPEPFKVPSLVPVSVRGEGEESIYDNRVSAILADLPVHVADPVERLAAVRAELSSLKASKEATAGEALVSLGRYTPFPVARWQCGSPSACRNGRSSRSPPMCQAPASRSTGLAASSWRSSLTFPSPPPSAPAFRSSPTAATSPSGSPATTGQLRTSRCWPTASRTAFPSSWQLPEHGIRRAATGHGQLDSAAGRSPAGALFRQPAQTRGQRNQTATLVSSWVASLVACSIWFAPGSRLARRTSHVEVRAN